MGGVKAGYWILPAAASRPFDVIRSGSLFTHVYLGFAQVNRSAFADSDQSVIVFPPEEVEIFENFPKNVHQIRNLKALLSIGGEGRSDDIAYVVRDPNRRKRFINDSIELARKFDYDGLDLCWLYPQATDSITPDQLSKFLGELLAGWRDNLDKEAHSTNRPNKLLLTAAVFHHRVIDPGPAGSFSYPIKALSAYLDWINVLAIDFHTPSISPQQTGPVHAWKNPKYSDRCGSAGIVNWIQGNGPNPVTIETKKLVLGIPFYGYQWTLANKNEHDFFADANPAYGDTLEFRTIQKEYIKTKPDRVVDDDAYGASYWHHEADWIGFPDARSIATRVGAALTEYNLRGYVAWHLEADDDFWTLSGAASKAWDDADTNP